MRRDIGFYIEADIEQVYKAYLSAAMNPPFERTCDQKPYHSISFGVNYSMKYNMNGGSCNIHLMPYGTGTAVNMRFSIAQLVGARYERYAEDLNTAMKRYLAVEPRQMQWEMDDFLKPQNQVTPQTDRQAIPQIAPVQRSAGSFCTQCGGRMAPGSRFCSNCGAAAATFCPGCGAQAQEGSKFCVNCGTRL